jgi:hypothetical protein
LRKVGQIVSDDFAVAVKIHDGLGVGVDYLVVASQPTAVSSLDPIRISNRSPLGKKIATGNKGVIENRRRVRHGTPLERSL